MNISENGLKLIKRFEGCCLSAYQDCVGVWTIGWGTTNADKSITGATISRGLNISKGTAETWLRKSLDAKYSPKVMKYDGIYHWSQNEFDALVSFAYNVGDIDELTARGKRTRAEIASAIPRYCKAGGRVVQGLKERRAAELALFQKGSPGTQTQKTPYPEPAGTVCSNETAAALKLTKWIPRGEAVKWVQWELCRLGYDLGTPAVDGIMGKRTTAAAKEFQRASGLTVDGAVGPKTRAALVKAKTKPVVSAAPKVESVNYRERMAAKAREIYPLCVGKVHGGPRSKLVTSLDALKKYDALSCNKMVSIVLQEAGLLPKGCLVEHTKSRSGKKKITDAVRGTEKLKHCKVYWVNKRFRDLPANWQAAGVVYIQDSNACISGGDGKIWSCNKGDGERYKGKGDYYRTGGYPFTSKILCVIVPD